MLLRYAAAVMPLMMPLFTLKIRWLQFSRFRLYAFIITPAPFRRHAATLITHYCCRAAYAMLVSLLEKY